MAGEELTDMESFFYGLLRPFGDFESESCKTSVVGEWRLFTDFACLH